MRCIVFALHTLSILFRFDRKKCPRRIECRKPTILNHHLQQILGSILTIYIPIFFLLEYSFSLPLLLGQNTDVLFFPFICLYTSKVILLKGVL